MDLLGFLRRPTVGEPAPDPASGPVYRAPAWQSAAPLQRTVAAPELITAPARFRTELVSWADPSLRGAPAHVVSPEAPSGLGHGLATIRPPAPAPAPETAPVQRQAAEPARAWRRLWTREAPVSMQRDTGRAPDIALDTGAAVGSAEVELPRPVLHVMSAPPPPTGLVRAEHAPLPPPVERPTVPLQRAAEEPVGGGAGDGVPEFGEPDVGVPGGDAVARPVAAQDPPLLQRTARSGPGDDAAGRPTGQAPAAVQRSRSPASAEGTTDGGEGAGPAATAVRRAWPARPTSGPDPAPAAGARLQRDAADRAVGVTTQRQFDAGDAVAEAVPAAGSTAGGSAPADAGDPAGPLAGGHTATSSEVAGTTPTTTPTLGGGAAGAGSGGDSGVGGAIQRSADGAGGAPAGGTVQRSADSANGAATGGAGVLSGLAGGLVQPSVSGAAGLGSGVVQRSVGDVGGVSGPDDVAQASTSGALGSSGRAGGAESLPGLGGVVQRTVGGPGPPSMLAGGAVPPFAGGGAGNPSGTAGGVVQPFEAGSWAPTGIPVPPARGVVQRSPSGGPEHASVPGAAGRPRRFGLGAPVQRAADGGLAASTAPPAPGSATDATAAGKPLAPLVSGGEALSAAETIPGSAAGSWASGSGPASAGGDVRIAWPHADHDEPTVQRAVPTGAAADVAPITIAGPDAASFGPVLGDDPLTPALRAEPVAATSSSDGPRSLPGAGTTTTVQRTTASGGPAGAAGVPLPGLPSGTTTGTVRAVPIQRAGAPGPWSPTRADGGAPVLVGLVGTRTPTGDGSPAGTAPDPATPAGPARTGTLLQRSAVSAGAPGGGRATVEAPGAAPRPGPPGASAPPPAVPASVQRLRVAQAAQQAAQQAAAQRDEETASETAAPPAGSPVEPVAVQTAATATDAPASAAVTTAPGAPAPGSGGVTDVDALVGKLYDPLVRRLKAELRLDRERAGHVLDLRQ